MSGSLLFVITLALGNLHLFLYRGKLEQDGWVSSTLALSLLWLLGVLCEQEGVYITSDEGNIESESLTSRASALTRKIAYKKAALLFLLSS